MSHPQDNFQEAQAHHRAGRLDQARALFTEYLEMAPGHAGALHHLGQIAFQKGDAGAALDYLGQAVAADGERAEIHADLGVVQRGLGNWEPADRHLRRAVGLAPNDAMMRYNLALLEGDLDRLEAAEEGYRQAISLNPDLAQAHNNLGNILKRQKRHDHAIQAYKAAIGADGVYAPAHKNLADSLESAGDAPGAAEAYRQAIHLRPDGGTRIRDALLLPLIPGSRDQILEWRARMKKRMGVLLDDGIRLADPVREVGATNFALAYHGLDDRDFQGSLAKLYLAACPGLAQVAPHCEGGGRKQGGRVRIGFVSSFFRSHTIARLFGGLIKGLPGQDFEVHVFSLSHQDDPLGREIAAAVDDFQELGTDLDEARQRIARAQLDILYFCDLGMEPLTYFLAFSRLAPVQCVSWGHPVTSGIPTLDYFMAPGMAEPPGAEAAYLEKLVRMPGPSIPIEAPPVAGPVERRSNLYICLQSLFKFHPDFDAMIGRILDKDRKGELLLLEGSHPAWAEKLWARWRRTIPHVLDRIKFTPRLARQDYLDLLAGASVMLDTPHFSGGLTSLEGLAMGMPVVSLPGDFLRGRLTAGFYGAMDIKDCLAESADEYADLAVRLATDEGWADGIRGKISERAPVLFENSRELEENASFFRRVLAG